MFKNQEFNTLARMVILIDDLEKNRGQIPLITPSEGLEEKLRSMERLPDGLEERVKAHFDHFNELSLLAPRGTPYTVELKTPEAIFAPIREGKKEMLSPAELMWLPCILHSWGERPGWDGGLLETMELFKVDG